MARISSGIFNKWLAAYGQAWEEGDVQKAADLFAEDAVYRETPFEEPLKGKDAIRAYWQDGAGSTQEQVSFIYHILDVRRNEGIAHWQAKFQRVNSGNFVELDGILVAEFDDSGLCTDFQEWWHRRETQNGDRED